MGHRFISFHLHTPPMHVPQQATSHSHSLTHTLSNRVCEVSPCAVFQPSSMPWNVEASGCHLRLRLIMTSTQAPSERAKQETMRLTAEVVL